ncbi:hypothetical protein YC2023_005903 [Brassica napus]
MATGDSSDLDLSFPPVVSIFCCPGGVARRRVLLLRMRRLVVWGFMLSVEQSVHSCLPCAVATWLSIWSRLFDSIHVRVASDLSSSSHGAPSSSMGPSRLVFIAVSVLFRLQAGGLSGLIGVSSFSQHWSQFARRSASGEWAHPVCSEDLVSVLVDALDVFGELFFVEPNLKE